MCPSPATHQAPCLSETQQRLSEAPCVLPQTSKEVAHLGSADMISPALVQEVSAGSSGNGRLVYASCASIPAQRSCEGKRIIG